MANKQNFTPDEWTKVLQSTMLVGIAVSAADPSGLWGALKEAARGSSAVIAARSNSESNELIKAVASDFETPQARSEVQKALKDCFAGAQPTDCVQRSLAPQSAARRRVRRGVLGARRCCRRRAGGGEPGPRRPPPSSGTSRRFSRRRRRTSRPTRSASPSAACRTWCRPARSTTTRSS